jgi:hypothetical protein
MLVYLKCAGIPIKWKSYGERRRVFMSQSESNESTENLKWLYSLVTEMPDVAFVEPVVQSFALLNNKLSFTNDELVIIGVSGLLATKARLVDEKRFQEITPYEYFHHSYVLYKRFKKEEPLSSEFMAFIDKIYK